MKFPEGTEFFDVDGVPVALLPNGKCVRESGESFPRHAKVFRDGTPISAEEFAALASEYNAA
jgi:hypothetical protein